MKKKILIMESEKPALEILSFVLNRDGYNVIQADDGLAGVELAEHCRPDLIILDLLPSMDSATTCRCLRESGVTSPVLVLTGPKDKTDRKTYTELGASDFIDQPFAISDLLMRVKIDTLNVGSEPFVVSGRSKRKFLGRITIDFTNTVISKDGVPLELTRQEYDIVCCLASDPGRVFSRDELLKTVWEYTGYNERHVDVAVHRLRLKIEDDPAKPSIIMNRKGKGYFFAQQT